MLSITLAYYGEAHTAFFFFFYTGPNNKGTSSKSWQWPIMYCRVSSGGTHSWMEWDGGTQSPLSYAWCHVTALNLLVTATVLNCSCVLLIFHHLIYNCKNAAWLISACFFFSPWETKRLQRSSFALKWRELQNDYILHLLLNLYYGKLCQNLPVL